MMRKLIIIDFEVLSKANFWMCCFKEIGTGKYYKIINDERLLKKYYEKNINSIWVGYNIKGYDQWILKSILAGLNPCKVSDMIIKDKVNPWIIDPNMNKFKLNFFELSSGERSLKELELFLGENIEESKISFDLETYPTEEQIAELTRYCLYDVKMTHMVFEELKEEYESQEFLIDFFGLEDSMFKKTKAQLSAYILGAKKPSSPRNDEFDFRIVDCIKLKKYKEVKDWYMNYANRDYKKSLTIMIYGVLTEFGWGGLHSARKQYQAQGFIVNSDVESFYPAAMIEFHFLSRNVSNPEKYVEIRDTRLEFKSKGDKREKPFKIVLNGTFGASKDENNELYDPQMANAVCVNGQLLLLDLIEKVEARFGDSAELIQANTDGVMFKFQREEDIKEYLKICEEWSRRTKMKLAHDMIDKVVQKDVNNYVFIQSDGKVKSKGAYVKKLSKIDNDLPIVNKAIREYIVNGIDIRDTIESSNRMIDFQKCVKIGKTYSGAYHNNAKIDLKVLRVFASKDMKDGPVLKVQSKAIANDSFMGNENVAESLTLSKIGNTPEKAFIYNKSVNEEGLIEKLDKEWYINLAEKRLNEFIPACQYEFTLFDMMG